MLQAWLLQCECRKLQHVDACSLSSCGPVKAVQPGTGRFVLHAA
jgi:hypothetical protein